MSPFSDEGLENIRQARTKQAARDNEVTRALILKAVRRGFSKPAVIGEEIGLTREGVRRHLPVMVDMQLLIEIDGYYIPMK